MSPLPPLTPLYMWAGGKTRLLKQYAPVFPDINQFSTYAEPFFGGGALWCMVNNVHPHLNTIIGEVNTELVQLLSTIRDTPGEFLQELESLVDEFFTVSQEKDARKAWYYAQRARYWDSPTSARLYLLMKLGFNGIWQTNKASNGLFATPAGLLTQTRRDQVVQPDLVRAWSDALQRAQLHAGGYDTFPAQHGPETLIYLDPPYRDSFTTYGTGFDDDDQRAVVHWFREATVAGSTVVLANRHVPGDRFFEDLLEDVADFHYFDVTYTAGRRKRVEGGHEAKPAVEFIAISR